MSCLTQAFLPLQDIPGLFDAFYKGDFCNNIDSSVPAFGQIIGLLPLIGQAVYTSPSHRGTVVGSTVINDLVTLYIGTNNGHVIQVNHWEREMYCITGFSAGVKFCDLSKICTVIYGL